MQQQLSQNDTPQIAPSHACHQLLRAVVRPSADDSQIRTLAEDVRDWEQLMRIAREHRVMPLLFTRLTEAEATLPAKTAQRLYAEQQRNVFHCMANAAELLAILETFARYDIDAMPFKGIVLAASVYGDANARAAGDVDLLVRDRDLKRATELMLERGYNLETPVGEDFSSIEPEIHENHFERPRDGIVAELRTRLELFGLRSDRELGMDWVWPRRQSVTLAGATVPDIDPETTLLMLCMHGSKHAWTRLSWIVDVAQLLTTHPGLDWSAIQREARRTGLSRTLMLGVLLAHRVADAPVPRDILRDFASVKAVRTLAEYIDENVFDPTLRKPPGFMTYSVRLLSIGDRLRLMSSPYLFRPNEHDRAFVKLPRSLSTLYYLVRPLRLLLDRSAR